MEPLLELLGIVVAVLLLGSFGARLVVGIRGRPGLPATLVWLAGAALIVVAIAGSHAAAEPGLLPIAASAVHWFATALWAGTAMHLAAQRTAQLEATPALFLDRYARLSLACLTVSALSGGLLAFVHLHNADAVATTSYGLAYRIKLGIAALLLVSVAVRQLPAASPARGRLHLRIEAALLLAALLPTALLATLPAPGLAPFLNPQTWQLAAGEAKLDIDLQPVAGRLGRVRFELRADPVALPEGTQISLSMMRADGQAGLQGVEALPIGPGEFLAETVIAMPGDWVLGLDISEPAGTRELRHEVTVPGPPLEHDLRAYLSRTTITYTRANVVSFIVGLLLIGVAAWAWRLARSGRAPGWLLVFGFANAALGGLLVLSVTFVRAYPSSFWHNPVPYTAASISLGDALYREHCAECHGLTGRGDGPWAFEHRGGRLPDLTAPHMDTHTDGEIYWWNRYGIPSLDMPGYEGVLTDEQNWTVINFIRSLRHGVPPEA